jgi:hypothetical protein
MTDVRPSELGSFRLGGSFRLTPHERPSAHAGGSCPVVEARRAAPIGPRHVECEIALSPCRALRDSRR